jgi:hypothetical protein
MILKWTAAWYELDQTIIVGDKLCKILPGENVSKIIKQFQPLLKDLP